MVRGQRIDVGDCVYHVINRANAKATIFRCDADYNDFEYLLNEIRETYDMRILAYIIMPNHWHLLLYPRKDGDLGKAMHWLTTSHVRRHHTRYNTIGYGHIYQGSYKSFLVQSDAHLLTVLKYIERNAVRAKLCSRTQEWRWGSAYGRINASRKSRLIGESPVPLPKAYLQWINDPEPAELLKDVRQSVEHTISYGDIVIQNTNLDIRQ